jgi:lipopolysaccharide export system protein LptC
MIDETDIPLESENGAPVKTHGLSFITPRETKRARKARSTSYTRYVSFLRIALPVGAVVVLAALFVWPMVTSKKIVTAVMKDIPDLVIDNLHFTGLDSQNQHYSITALKATRVVHDSGMYDLDKPEGEIELNSGAWIAGKAQAGRLDETNHRLWLGGNVHMFHDLGYEFTTSEAQVDMANHNAWGDKPVVLQGSFGEIHGKGFQLYDSGNVIVIKGPAKAILTPGAHRDTPDSPANTAPNPDLHPSAGSDKPSKVKKGQH